MASDKGSRGKGRIVWRQADQRGGEGRGWRRPGAGRSQCNLGQGELMGFSDPVSGPANQNVYFLSSSNVKNVFLGA